jgi:hypothetical protein
MTQEEIKAMLLRHMDEWQIPFVLPILIKMLESYRDMKQNEVEKNP